MDTKTRHHARAYLGEHQIAKTDEAIYLEGNYYFPRGALSAGLLAESERTYVCPWKGEANYFDLYVDDHQVFDAAWTYRTPSEAAADIAEMIAFDAFKGIRIVTD